jgi:hypothetical protein
MLEIFGDIITLINRHFVRGLLASGLVLLLYRIATKNYPVVNTALFLLRIVVVMYCLLSLSHYLLAVTFSTEDYISRLTGSYFWSYALLLFGHLMLPLVLLTKKPGRNIYFFLITVFFMNIGWVFELFVIRMSSLDSNDSGRNPAWLFFPSDAEIAAGLKGSIIGLVAIGIAHYSSRTTTELPESKL